ncbi:MAG: orotate phosphoribosyltransferase [Nitrospira sp.]
MPVGTVDLTLAEMVDRHRPLYQGSGIDAKLNPLIRAGSSPNLRQQDILNILRTSRSVFFDTHVEVVSGHHTATYLRFESIAHFPELIQQIAGDMADWIRRMFQSSPITGLVATCSAAELLAQGVADVLHDTTGLRVALTPYSCETGRIGTDINVGTIKAGERFLALNDVTTRGNCVSKLGKVITDHGGVLAGMMVFARRDSGQFPLMNELIARHPFYYTTDLDMPQWESAHCPLCRAHKPLLSWKDMPAL